MDEFCERLRAVKARGDLTFGDVATWLDRRTTTVRAWIVREHPWTRGHYITPGEQERLLDALVRLEKAVDDARSRGERGLVPHTVTYQGRAEFIRGMRNDYLNSGVPGDNSSG